MTDEEFLKNIWKIFYFKNNYKVIHLISIDMKYVKNPIVVHIKI